MCFITVAAQKALAVARTFFLRPSATGGVLAAGAVVRQEGTAGCPAATLLRVTAGAHQPGAVSRHDAGGTSPKLL